MFFRNFLNYSKISQSLDLKKKRFKIDLFFLETKNILSTLNLILYKAMSIVQDNDFDLHASLSEIECLKDIYKLDLKAVFSSVLNKENFTNYFSIVSSILSILDKESVESKNDQSIEDHCDRILEFCLERIHISLGKVTGQHKVLFSQFSQIIPTQPELDIILKYFRLCIPRASIRMKFTLFKIYLIYFIKFINGKYESINVTLDVKESLRLLNCFDTDEINAFMTSNLSVSEYNLKQRNFLTSFFTLVLNESSNFGNGKVEKAIIEFIIDYNLFLQMISQEGFELCVLAATRLIAIEYLAASKTWNKF